MISAAAPLFGNFKSLLEMPPLSSELLGVWIWFIDTQIFLVQVVVLTWRSSLGHVEDTRHDKGSKDLDICESASREQPYKAMPLPRPEGLFHVGAGEELRFLRA